MSHNFELLSQLETELQSRRAIPREVFTTAKPLERMEADVWLQELVSLAQTVFLSGDADAPHEVVLFGVDRDNGSSEICFHLGRILARQSTRPVCLADASAHNPRLLTRLEQKQNLSLPDQDQCIEIEPQLWICDLLSNSPPSRAGLASADKLREHFSRLKSRFRFILIDAPGANAGGDAALLSQLVDGAILIIEANVTRKVAALRAKQALEAMNAKLLGLVLNNRTFPIPSGLYRRL